LPDRRAGGAVTEDNDRERPRKSWREVDAQRDRSAHTTRSERDRERAGRRGKPSTKSYKAALDKLFENGGIARLLDEAAAKDGDGRGSDEGTGTLVDTKSRLTARVRDALGPDEVTKAVDAYLAKYGRPPEEFEFLGPMLQHRDAARVSEAMVAISAMLDTGLRPRRPRAIAALLRTIEEVGDDPDLKRQAHELWRRVG
jgi:hypothetical protein